MSRANNWLSMAGKVFSLIKDTVNKRGRAGGDPGDRRPPQRPGPRRSPAPSGGNVDERLSPGREGNERTVEVDASQISAVRMTYQPNPDGNPDPGEVVWTWVPFEENDGRGKDRPVLIVAAEAAGTVLGVQLTSKRHEEYLPVGTGGWDDERRQSYADPTRVIRIYASGMRREGTALAQDRFVVVAAELQRRYGWSNAG
ncbi:type II toxin-antitoxin system PemK/MazF family toxin [Nakamurella aerolata]|uniref:Type II toxin-antitoxin system PemK/MazF family toxin n=1 Tax=Nakamurella aerolata TaxID=1656892 RepID=A0A849AAP6_9ACTN|nr:type II toxin-antitoxin system PemK/MazF family toxin [Nakamurella aerolata]NNG36208.1 type II toxin-antitoxin system PemK/MazF family toxin [Nakamurella aerolata]